MKAQSEARNNLTYQVNQDIIHQRVGEDIILINLKSDRIFSLNRTGARFFELLSEHRPIPEIKEKLLAEFDVDPETLDDEILNILDNLLEESFIYADNE